MLPSLFHTLMYLLPGAHSYVECLWRLEYEHDRATQIEPVHLLRGRERLSIESRGDAAE